MNLYARIDDGQVVEIIQPFEDVPIKDRFHPDVVRSLVDITGIQPQPTEGFLFDGSVFAAPPTEPRQDEPEEPVEG